MIIYTRTITDDEQRILEHRLVDVSDWINKAIDGKIDSCATLLAKETADKLSVSGVEMMPANRFDLIQEAFKDPEYQNRIERDAEIKGEIIDGHKSI